MILFKCYGEKLLLKELKGCYKFFMKEANWHKKSNGYGLIRDKSEIAPEIASIASVGYGLASLVIGVKRNWLKYENAYNKALGTLNTFINNVEGKNGFYYHFVNMNSGKREWNCEISIIDTAIFICGALLVGNFFGKEVKNKADYLYKKINWQWFSNPLTNQFYMGYSPEKGFWGSWDMYAEQLMLYILGLGSPTFPINKDMYYSFEKPITNYGNIENIIYTYCGTLFTYQFSHAWIDFRNTIDSEGINWFTNSIKATLANREYCIKNSKKFKTLNENSWGLTACVGPNGYSGGFGAMPAFSDLDKENDGTISPCGAAGSIVFTPELSIKALENYYNNYPKLWSKYGFRDAYNLESSKPWYSKESIGIDKGITLIMIENYLTGLIWNIFMEVEYVNTAIEKLGLKRSLIYEKK